MKFDGFISDGVKGQAGEQYWLLSLAPDEQKLLGPAGGIPNVAGQAGRQAFAEDVDVTKVVWDFQIPLVPVAANSTYRWIHEDNANRHGSFREYLKRGYDKAFNEAAQPTRFLLPPERREIHSPIHKDMEAVVNRVESDPMGFLKNVLVQSVLLELDEEHHFKHHPSHIAETIGATIDMMGAMNMLDTLVETPRL